MKPILLRYSRCDFTPNSFILICARVLEKMTFSRVKKIELLRRYLETNRLPILSEMATEDLMPALEILFVCAGKDLELLPIAVEAALRATKQHELHGVTIVVPERDLIHAQNLTFQINQKVTILSESEKIPQDIDRRIREVFRGRAGWVIQQILKVLCVSDSNAPGVLVCDSDTILTLNRIWFDTNGKQILTPSWERTAPYYKFLADLGLGSERPKYTFVSHHMLMQPKFMLEARQYVKWISLENLVDNLTVSYNGSDLSPFCIEFELYAQYMMQFRSEHIHLVKWSNLSLPRDKQAELHERSKQFASVSLHDYLV
jgi:hypothetical protein